MYHSEVVDISSSDGDSVVEEDEKSDSEAGSQQSKSGLVSDLSEEEGSEVGEGEGEKERQTITGEDGGSTQVSAEEEVDGGEGESHSVEGKSQEGVEEENMVDGEEDEEDEEETTTIEGEDQ